MSNKKDDNPVPSLDNKDLVSFLHTLIFQLGINTAHDYDGLESDEDIIIYQNSVIKRIKTLQNGVETAKEQPKLIQPSNVIITQLFQQFVQNTLTRPKLVIEISKATRFQSVELAKIFVKHHYGKEIVFQYVTLG